MSLSGMIRLALLVQDFTVAELQSLAGNLDNDAKRSAEAKMPHMRERFQSEGEAWGRQAGLNAYDAHKDEIDKLTGPPRQVQ